MNIFDELKQTFKKGNSLIKLIYINIAVFILIKVFNVIGFLINLPSFSGSLIGYYLSVPASIPRLALQPWSIFSYMFLHQDFMHILFNMLWLYWFGKIFLEYLSEKKLLTVYILGGLSGAFLYILSYNVFPVFQPFVEKILKGILNFGNLNVSAIMCPRIDVTAFDLKWGFDKVVGLIVSSGFSRIPVYTGSFDAVKGILYAKDILPYSANSANFKWQALLRPPYFVPETKKINDLLKEFQTRKIHMAVVIDEYGGTSGIVTLEDILEEIVGEITDESDEDQAMFRKIDEKIYIFEGKILLNDFCRIIGVEENVFEEVRGEAETLAGLLLELTGEIPQKDQIIRLENFIFRIESADRRRVKEIRVEILNKNEVENKV